MAYTYETIEPELYFGKRFRITMDDGLVFDVSTATGEDQIPDLVAFYLAHSTATPTPPATPSVAAVSKEQQLAFNHENRLRALEGQPPMTLEDFIIQLMGSSSDSAMEFYARMRQS